MRTVGRVLRHPISYGVGTAVATLFETLTALGIPSVQSEHDRVVWLAVGMGLFLLFATLTFIAQHARIRELERKSGLTLLHSKFQQLGSRYRMHISFKVPTDRSILLDRIRLLVASQALNGGPLASECTEGVVNPIHQEFSFQSSTVFDLATVGHIYAAIGVTYRDEADANEPRVLTLYFRWGGVEVRNPDGSLAVPLDLPYCTNQESIRIVEYAKQHNIVFP